jgi:hypothetical protein
VKYRPMLNAGDVESPRRTAVFPRDLSIGVLKPNNVSGRRRGRSQTPYRSFG